MGGYVCSLIKFGVFFGNPYVWGFILLFSNLSFISNHFIFDYFYSSHSLNYFAVFFPLFFWGWIFLFSLAYFTLLGSSFIHLIRIDSSAFFFNSCVIFRCVYVPQLPYSFGHLGCFHVLAIIDSAEMKTGVHVSLSILVSSVCMPSSGIAGS